MNEGKDFTMGQLHREDIGQMRVVGLILTWGKSRKKGLQRGGGKSHKDPFGMNEAAIEVRGTLEKNNRSLIKGETLQERIENANRYIRYSDFQYHFKKGTQLLQKKAYYHGNRAGQELNYFIRQTRKGRKGTFIEGEGGGILGGFKDKGVHL